MAAHNPTTSKHLEDQAAAAALYVTEPHKQVRDSRKDANYPLDANGKLTSAGAAASLKRADARDLPSFPSAGLAQAAAGGAAGLAVQNTKSPEWWKPEASAGASKAALIANDYKMKPLWQPEASAAGSKAALLAHKKGPGLDLWEPSASDKALIAATGAAAGQKGIQHGKAPTSDTGLADRYPDERNAAKNALKAATSVHTTQSRQNDLPGYSDEEAAKIRNQAMVKGMSGDLFGSKPLIGPELQEREHQAALHASAVKMAQGMYGKRDEAYREKMSAAQAGSRAAHARGLDDDSDDESSPMSFMGLQEAAQKLANERLSKLNDPDAAYREHYGTNSPPPKSRLSMFGGGSLRKKDSDEDIADEKRSRRIRGEMNLFQDKLKEIDARKRKEDRSALLAAAQRNVKALSAEMDEDVFQRTGKMSPAMKADWEAQARARAQAQSEERNANFGKVKLGGGKYMDQTEIEAIAQNRLQPTLDAITAKAEHDRDVDEQNRLEEEERKRIEREQKEQEKYTNMKIKEEWKKFKAEEKAEEQAHKQEQKAVESEEKQARQDAKMQEKFEHQKEKEAEREAREAEKEKERQQKEEWKAFKEKEKEEERARKEENRLSKGSRLGSLFRRKSKKEKDPGEKDSRPTSTVVPASAGETTTTITSGESPTSASVNRDSVHHEEPTTDTKSANQQKPGADILSVFKRKKADQDDRKRLSKTETATAGAATGAAVGALAAESSNGSAHVGKEALAPEHSDAQKVDTSKVEDVPTTTEPATATTAPTIETPSVPATSATVTEPAGMLDDPQIAALTTKTNDSEKAAGIKDTIVPATTTAATVTAANVDHAEKPAVHDAGHKDASASAAASVPTTETVQESTPVQHQTAAETAERATSAPVAESAPVHQTAKTANVPETVVDDTDPISPMSEDYETPPATAPVGPQAAGPLALGSDKAATSEDAAPTALGSDKPVTSEVKPSIVDKLDPRANVGKPGFTGSEKFAAATADMRGTDHAGAKEESKPSTSAEPPAATASSTQPTSTKATLAEATHEGGKVSAPVSERISVPAEAIAAAEESTDKGGKHGTPRQAEQKKQNRLSGFFKNKLGIKVKEHKGSDGVAVTPTTQYTTLGKYVDPNDKHSNITPAAVPANAAALENAQGSSNAGVGPSTSSTGHADASTIAVDPEFQQTDDNTNATASRGRVGGKAHSEENDEARDTVSEALPLPKAPGVQRASESPARETRFKEELFG